MHIRLLTIALVTFLAACATEHVDTANWRGKTLALATRSEVPLEDITRGGEFLIGATGGVADVGKGAVVAAESGIEDPARRVAEDLFKVAQDKYGVTAAPAVPLSRLANVSESVRAAATVDLLLDVKSFAITISPLFSHYSVGINMDARLIDIRAGKALADSFCQQHANSGATHEELLADQATRLKALLAAQREACFQKFKVEVLGVRP